MVSAHFLGYNHNHYNKRDRGHRELYINWWLVKTILKSCKILWSSEIQDRWLTSLSAGLQLQWWWCVQVKVLGSRFLPPFHLEAWLARTDKIPGLPDDKQPCNQALLTNITVVRKSKSLVRTCEHDLNLLFLFLRKTTIYSVQSSFYHPSIRATHLRSHEKLWKSSCCQLLAVNQIMKAINNCVVVFKNVVRSQDPLQLHGEWMKQINPILNKQMHLNWIEFNQSGARWPAFCAWDLPLPEESFHQHEFLNLRRKESRI
jgi:hypothetical protein